MRALLLTINVSFAVGLNLQLLAADAPQVVRAQGMGEMITLWGTGFDKRAEVHGWTASPNKETFAAEALTALGGGGFRGVDLLPAQPLAGARRLSPAAVDPNGLTLAVNLPARNRDVVWVKNASGWSRPFMVDAAQPWFLYPQKARPGGTIRVLGRELSRPYRPAVVAMRPAKGGTPRELKKGGDVRNARYETQVRLPDDLAAGDYEIFVNNSAAGVAGWSDPLKLTVVATNPSPPRPVFNVTQFGAKGDGLHDDSDALAAAIERARVAGGGVVYLPVGNFGLSRTLELPEGVELRGVCMNTTTIEVRDEQPLRGGLPKHAQIEGYPSSWPLWWAREGWEKTPMLWMRHRSSVSNLHLRLGSNKHSLGILVARAPGTAEDLTVERVRFSCPSGATSIMLLGETYGLTIRENEFAGVAIDSPAARHEQAYIGYNRIRAVQHGFPLQGCNLLFLRGTIRSIVEENDIRDGDRNICFQSGRRWAPEHVPEGKSNSGRASFHTALIGNRFTNNIPRRHNAGEIMFEGGGIFWHGKADAHGLDCLTVNSAPFNSELTENYVLVLDGPGLGQYRRIVTHNEKTLNLDRPWDLIPAASSHVAVGNFVAEHLWLDNTDEHIAGWTGFWGGHIGHVIDGHINRDGSGLYLWAFSPTSVVAFVDIHGCWVSNRGRVVLRGPGLIFGNGITQNEVIDFHYRPSQHGTLNWAHPQDATVLRAREAIVEQAGVQIQSSKLSPDLPATAPARHWNVVERNLLLHGRRGIVVEPGAQYSILSRNVIDVTADSIVDQGEHTVIGRQFTKHEE